MISHRNGCNYRSIEKRSLTLPDTILEDPQTHAVTWLVHTPMHRNRSKCMYDSFNTYICIYIYTHTAKCPTRNPAKKHSINIAIPSFNIIYIIYQALWKHPSLSFKRYLEKPIGVSKCPPHFLQPPRSTRWIFCLLITSQLWR